MEEPLTKQEILFLKEGAEFYESSKKKVFWITLISAIVIILIMTALKYPLDFIGFVILLGCVLGFYIWYSVFGKSAIRIKKDIKRGVKMVQQTTIQQKRVKKGRIGFNLSNGFKITQEDYHGKDLRFDLMQVGQKVMVSYTPYYRMIMNIEIKE